MNVFTKELFVYFRIESLFEALMPWYYDVAVKK